jgi:hypothetical protein
MQPSDMLAHSVYIISLNPLDFYLWGHPKTFVNSDPIVNEETLDQCIFLCLSDYLQLSWDV